MYGNFLSAICVLRVLASFRYDRPALRKGRSNKRVKVIREIAREVMGLAPYERRMLELSKVGKDKRALKLASKKLGSLKRAKKKKDDLMAWSRKK